MPLILFLYRIGTASAAPLLRRMLRRRLTSGKEIAARLPEREGFETTPRPPGRLLWLHAASVGETLSVLPLLAALARAAPDARVLMTTGTVTSASLLERRLPELGLEQAVTHRFVPLDVPAWANRFLDHWRPDVAAFVESEIWPNLLEGCRARGIPTVLLNARMSASSFARWRRMPGLAGRLLGGFALIQAQTEVDAHRLRALGGSPSGPVVNLKYAAAPLPADAAELARLRRLLARRPVWLAAQTHPPEDAAIAAVHALLADGHPGLVTIVVPRHPERGPAMAAALRQSGISTARRGAGEDPPAEGGIWIADTLGELGLFYRLVGHAFVGRSLGAQGGQNPLEPARLGCPVAVGPDVANFADVVAALEQAGALTRVADAQALARWVDAMLRDPGLRAAIGERGIVACRRTEDLPERSAAALAELLARGAG